MPTGLPPPQPRPGTTWLQDGSGDRENARPLPRAVPGTGPQPLPLQIADGVHGLAAGPPLRVGVSPDGPAEVHVADSAAAKS